MHWRGSAQGSLVERELSAKLTEGLLYCSIDIRTNSTEISADFVVGDTKDSQPIPLQKSGVAGIILLVVLWLHDNPSVTAYAVPPPFTQGRL